MHVVVPLAAVAGVDPVPEVGPVAPVALFCRTTDSIPGTVIGPLGADPDNAGIDKLII